MSEYDPLAPPFWEKKTDRQIKKSSTCFEEELTALNRSLTLKNKELRLIKTEKAKYNPSLTKDALAHQALKKEIKRLRERRLFLRREIERKKKIEMETQELNETPLTKEEFLLFYHAETNGKKLLINKSKRCKTLEQQEEWVANFWRKVI